MAKFRLKPAKGREHVSRNAQFTGFTVNLGESEELVELRMRAKKVALSNNITLSGMLKQMIKHCLDEIEGK